MSQLLKEHNEELWRHLEVTTKETLLKVTLISVAFDLAQSQLSISLRQLKPDAIFYNFSHWVPALARSLGIKAMYLPAAGVRVFCAMLILIRRRLLAGERLGQTILFVKTKERSIALHKALGEYCYGCTTLFGKIENEIRYKIVQEFKNILTDLLARGFDQSQVNLVINYNIPAKHRSPSEPDYEVYLHICVRVRRSGRKGVVFNFLCTEMDCIIMNEIKDYFNCDIREIPNCESEEDIERALRSAGLL